MNSEELFSLRGEIFRVPSTNAPVGVELALEHVLPCEDLLYHFTSLETGLEKILPNRTLRFAPLVGTNDPLEFEDIIHVGIDLDLGDEGNEVLRQGDRVKMIRRQTLLACFCSEKIDPADPVTPFSKGWKRARMWAQYANNHRGICCVFHKERFEAAVESALPNRWKPLKDFVGYREEYDLGAGILKSTTLRPGDAFKESAQARLAREAKALLFSKFHDFRDEREWRMVLIPDEQTTASEHFVPVRDSLQAVILGAKFPDIYEAVVLGLAKCEVFRVDWFHGRAALRTLKRSAV
ncbi:MAG TPA: DUF2971 domain-containing protein [Fibrobacteria bacterium]|nr:DUF2971 domain-containing protein [Fibrobacteria bacterium]